MNIDKKRKRECLNANCGLDKARCLVYFGSNCIRQGGSRIPLQSALVSERVKLKSESLVKPYFICDGREITEGREF